MGLPFASGVGTPLRALGRRAAASLRTLHLSGRALVATPGTWRAWTSVRPVAEVSRALAVATVGAGLGAALAALHVALGASHASAFAAIAIAPFCFLAGIILDVVGDPLNPSGFARRAPDRFMRLMGLACVGIPLLGGYAAVRWGVVVPGLIRENPLMGGLVTLQCTAVQVFTWLGLSVVASNIHDLRSVVGDNPAALAWQRVQRQGRRIGGLARLGVRTPPALLRARFLADWIAALAAESTAAADDHWRHGGVAGVPPRGARHARTFQVLGAMPAAVRRALPPDALAPLLLDPDPAVRTRAILAAGQVGAGA